MTDPDSRPPETTPGTAGGEADQLADILATAALSCPAVARLSGGRFGVIATYPPGRQVTWMRLEPDRVQVHAVGVVVEDLDTGAGQARLGPVPDAAYRKDPQ